MQYFGTTEISDPAFHLEIFDHLYDGNIIITKRLTDKLIEKLIEDKDKCILHLTCTGMGQSKLEPLVPDYLTSFEKCKKLIDGGFPISHIVLRVDPIVPTDKGFETAKKVIEKFSELYIGRVRFSYLDMYTHVVKRFNESGIRLPYSSFHAPYEVRKKYTDKLIELSAEYNFQLESCAEPGIPSVACVSQKDIDILDLNGKIKLEGFKGQRKSCFCPENKKELIKDKPKRCENGCIYCFWQN